MRVGFIPNMGKENIIPILQEAKSLCEKNGLDVWLPADLEEFNLPELLGVPTKHVLPRPEFFKHLDMAFSFGGDGTLIHLARQIYEYDVPLSLIHI